MMTRKPSMSGIRPVLSLLILHTTVELQWLEHFWDYENLFETGVVRASEGLL